MAGRQKEADQWQAAQKWKQSYRPAPAPTPAFVPDQPRPVSSYVPATSKPYENDYQAEYARLDAARAASDAQRRGDTAKTIDMLKASTERERQSWNATQQANQQLSLAQSQAQTNLNNLMSASLQSDQARRAANLASMNAQRAEMDRRMQADHERGRQLFQQKAEAMVRQQALEAQAAEAARVAGDEEARRQANLSSLRDTWRDMRAAQQAQQAIDLAGFQTAKRAREEVQAKQDVTDFIVGTDVMSRLRAQNRAFEAAAAEQERVREENRARQIEEGNRQIAAAMPQMLARYRALHPPSPAPPTPVDPATRERIGQELAASLAALKAKNQTQR